MTDEINARAFGRNLPISTKQAIEICNWIRGKNVQKAKNMLEGVIKMKVAVPFRRFNKDMGHKKGRIAAGRFPVKSSGYILDLIKSAEINAQMKGMSMQNLFVKEIIANKGSGVLRYGRKRGITAKRTHIEVVLLEKEAKKVNKK
jgi:large subunit ribosomal protein L22